MRKLILLLSIFFGSMVFVNAQAEKPDFYEQLKLIMALGNADNFKSIQGDLIESGADGTKTYSFPLPLDGFSLTILHNGNNRTIIALGNAGGFAQGYVRSMMNSTMRTIGGLPYYTSSDYKAANPVGLESFESVTELTKPGGSTKIQIYKMLNENSYFLLISSFNKR